MKTIAITAKPQNFLLNLRYVMASLLILLVFSCNTEEIDSIEEMNTELTIVEVLEEFDSTEFNRGGPPGPTFRTLSVALARTGLASTVSKNRLTVFAPTDDAFAAYGLNQRNILSVPNLEDILLYHVLAGVVTSDQLSNGFVPTVNGAFIEVNLDSGVMINDANVILADRRARNGVIHAIDDILFPPTMDLISKAGSFAPEFSILAQAVEIAGLTDTLMTGGPFTVFAPTNQAFIDLLGTLDGIDSLEDIPVDLLRAVLLYHVVDGYAFSSDLSNGYVPTLNGAAVNVNLDSGVFINDSEVIIPNVQATNGVIHAINKVLFPPTMNLVGVAASFAPEFSILLEAATKAGLADTLMNGGPFTVFAPTNDAFIALLGGLEGFDSLDDFDTPEEIAFLQSVLLYHVVDGRVYSSDLSNQEVPTLNGASITVNLDGGVFINQAEVVIPDVQATNGVIHVINSVLVP
jgi:transforming growth factor-beta-induced protein